MPRLHRITIKARGYENATPLTRLFSPCLPAPAAALIRPRVNSPPQATREPNCRARGVVLSNHVIAIHTTAAETLAAWQKERRCALCSGSGDRCPAIESLCNVCDSVLNCDKADGAVLALWARPRRTAEFSLCLRAGRRPTLRCCLLRRDSRSTINRGLLKDCELNAH